MSTLMNRQRQRETFRYWKSRSPRSKRNCVIEFSKTILPLPIGHFPQPLTVLN